MYGAARSQKSWVFSFSGRHEFVVRLVLGATLLLAAALKSWFPDQSVSNDIVGNSLAWPLNSPLGRVTDVGRWALLSASLPTVNPRRFVY